jgi:hypothetical protein
MYKELKHNTFANAPAEAVFYACRGDRIDNIHDLANCVESLSLEEFRQHVNANKNDFANWIHHVLKNPGLAHDLNYPVNRESKEHFVKTIRDHVAWLQTV